MRQKDETKTKRSKATKLIALNTLFVIFGLASAFTGTAAWFQSNRTVEKTVGSFQVSALPGVEFDLYYLDKFVDNSGADLSDGNWNTDTYLFSGYEVEYTNAVFTKVTYSNDQVSNTCTVPNPSGSGTISSSCNPTNITHLWPAHKLTFAIAITSGDFAKLTLEEWAEATIANAAHVDADTPVSLAWAIDIYGAVFKVPSQAGDELLTEDQRILAEVNRGFVSYHSASKSDVFDYHETYLDPSDEPSTPMDVIPSAPSGTGRTIAYFTIEFSDDPSTWYQLLQTGYYQQSNSGNSNCYEGLQLTKLAFSIK